MNMRTACRLCKPLVIVLALAGTVAAAPPPTYPDSLGLHASGGGGFETNHVGHVAKPAAPAPRGSPDYTTRLMRRGTRAEFVPPAIIHRSEFPPIT